MLGYTGIGVPEHMECGGFGFNVGEGSGPIGLGLELGCGSGFERSKSLGFTVFQLQELKLQSLIYKYMEAGLPVPHHLVLPIWKSAANCFTPPHHLYSTSMGPLNLEYRNGLDLEPGRCRRTDGKKWRCSKEAVQDHKYCEKHLHRGRQRSRKLVEAASQQNTSTNAKTDLSISLGATNNTRHTHHLAPPPAFSF